MLIVAVGILLVILGLLCNERTIASLLSPDNKIESLWYKTAIYLFEALVIASGVFIIIRRSYIDLKDLAAFAVIVFLSVAFLEMLSRIWFYYIASPGQFLKFARYEDLENTQPMYSPHTYLNYCLTPNYQSIDKLNRHNSLGYRGEEIKMPKPKDKFRIVVLGGSAVYTTAVRDYRKSFPAALENVLKKDYGYINVEIINGGVCGYSSWESLINLEFRVLDLNPDLIIVYHGANDAHARFVEPSSYRGDNSGLRKQWATPEYPPWERSVLLRILNRKLHILPYPFRGLEDYIVPRIWHGIPKGRDEKKGIDPMRELEQNSPKYFEHNLRNMVTIAEEHGVRVVLVTWAFSPLFSGTSHSLHYAATEHYRKIFSENNNVVRKVAKDYGVLLFDFAGLMPADKEFWDDGTHVNEKGALMKAKLFAKFINDSHLIRSAEPLHERIAKKTAKC